MPRDAPTYTRGILGDKVPSHPWGAVADPRTLPPHMWYCCGVTCPHLESSFLQLGRNGF